MKKVAAKSQRWYKDVGLGFKTPAEAINGTYIGTFDRLSKPGRTYTAAAAAVGRGWRRWDRGRTTTSEESMGGPSRGEKAKRHVRRSDVERHIGPGADLILGLSRGMDATAAAAAIPDLYLSSRPIILTACLSSRGPQTRSARSPVTSRSAAVS